MPKDEFNSITVTNESQIRGVEFGGTQNTEFSFGGVKRGGINDTADDELNDEIEEVKDTKQQGLTLEEQQDLIEQATESSNASAPTTAPASGGTTATSSAGTAAASSSGAAASSSAAVGGVSASAAASTAAAAGTIVVAAFAVTTAAPVIMSQAVATIRFLEPEVNDVFYGLEIKDKLEDEDYFVTLSNETYNKTEKVEFHSDDPLTTGYFFDLTPDTEYVFEVTEGSTSDLTRSLAKQTVRTKPYVEPEPEPEPEPEKVSEFRGITVFHEANFVTGAFTVQMDFIDEKEIFSGFALLLTDGEIEYNYPLEPNTNVQTLSLKEPTDGQFDRYGLFSYTFTYMDDGQPVSIQSESQFTFTDISGSVSTLNDVTINSEVDFLSKELSVTLDFDDALEILDNFQLHICYTDEKNVEHDEVYPLIGQISAQPVVTDELLPYENSDINITYYATCDRRGEQIQTDVKSITFTDIEHRASIFRSATLSSTANYLSGTLYVTLDYEDGFERFQSVELVLKDIEIGDHAYPLDWKTEQQPVSVDDDSDEGGYLLRRIQAGEEMEYEIRYYLKSSPNTAIVIASGATSFTDNSGAVTSLDSVSIDNSVDFLSDELKVTLSYSDPFDQLYLFKLHIKYEPEEDDPVELEFDLVGQTTEQIVHTGTILPYEEIGEYTYYATCEGNNGELITPDKTITFTDYLNRESNFNGAMIDSEASFKNNTMYVTLDYVDGFGRFTGAELVLSEATGASYHYTLSMTTAKQPVGVNDFTSVGGDSMADGPDITSGTTFDYMFYYYVTGEDTGYYINNGTVTFTDPTIFTLTGLTIGEADFEENTFDVQLSYTGDITADDVYSLELELIDDTQGGSCNVTLGKKNTLQTFSVTEMLDLEHDSFTVVIRQYVDDTYQNYKEIYNQSNVAFTDKQGRTSGVRDITFTKDNDGKVIYNSVSGVITVQLDYSDFYNQYAMFALLLYSDAGSNTFQLESTTDQQTLDIHEYFPNIDGEAELTYDLEYSLVTDGEQLISAKGGTITLKDYATDQITGLNYSNLVYSEGSYYLPFKLSLGEKYESSDLSLRITDNSGGSQYLIQVSDTGNPFLDEGWQYCYFTCQDIDTFIDNAENIEVYYNDTTEHILYSEPVLLYLQQEGGDFNPLGMRFNEYITSDGFTVRYFLYEGDFGTFNGEENEEFECHLKFVFEDTTEYEDCYFTYPGGYGYSFMVSCEDDNLQSRLEGGYACDIYLVYEDGDGVTQTVLIYKNFSFQV